MGTSIRDLFATLDEELAAPASSPAIAVGDSARLLQIAGGMLSRLAESGLDIVAEGPHTEAARALSEACVRASAVFSPTHGRCSDVVGAASDLVSLRLDELTRSDRGFITEAVGQAARLAAERIIDSGPYSHVSALAEVRFRCTQLARSYARFPVRGARLEGIDRPLPMGTIPFERSADRIVLESLSQIVDGLSGQQLASVRELHAVAMTCGRLDYSRDWESAASRLRLLVDGRDPEMRAPGSLIYPCSRIHEVMAQGGSAIAPELVRTLLDRVTEAFEFHVKRGVGLWVVPVGHRMLSEQRAGEWLLHESFVVAREDIPVLVPTQRRQ